MNKNLPLICVIFLLFSQAGFAQDEAQYEAQDEAQKVISVGIGPEINTNARANFAGGLSLSIDFQLPVSAAQLAAGLVVGGSYNFTDTIVLETTGMFRWYFLGVNHTGFFAQVDLGLHLIMEQNVTVPGFEGGLRAGFRMPLGEAFYIEPYGRFGYPYFWGVGILAGMRFQLPENSSGSRAGSNAGGNSDTEE